MRADGMDMAHFDAPRPLLPDLIDGQSRWLGDKLAVISDEGRLTWREFGQRIRQVATALQRDGVAPGDRVVVLMSNGLAMLETLFGVLRAGACVVPLNVSVADPAVAAMIKDCGAIAVITTSDHASRLDPAAMTHVRLWVCEGSAPPVAPWQDFRQWRDTELRSERVRPTPLDPEAACNIIYSSGTTGLPKGIVHTHRRRIDWAYGLALALRYDSRAVTLCSIGLYSNISWVSMLSTLVVGGTLVIERSFQAATTLATIARERVTHTSLVPVMVQRLLESAEFKSADLRSLRAMMCCGSPLPLDVKQRALTEFGCAFIELYGLTEGIITTLDPEEATSRPTSVGKPLPGTELIIINDDDQPVEAGECGEIVGRGYITMSGYYRRPDANADSTWVDSSGRKWLRTGDIGRLDAAGYLYVVDRKKDMIISGGQNIYPADIESVLATAPEVLEAAVIGVPSKRWGETPYAVVVARPGTASSTEAAESLRQWVNSRVGKQQRLAGVTFIDHLPRNPNGKILKRQLRTQFNHALE